MKTLYLTPAEQKLFDALPASLREGWEVSAEEIVYEDSEQRRRIRMQQAHFIDPRLRQIRASYGAATTIVETEHLLETTDLTDLEETDVREILYALGPDVLSAMIAALIKEATTDKHIEEVTGYTVARHLFFGRS